MPKGKDWGPRHKGARRQFTDEDTLARETKELSLKEKKRGEADDEADSSDEEEVEQKQKVRGVEHLIESENPNHAKPKTKKLSQLSDAAGQPEAPQLSRREREELQRQRDKEAYERLHAQGKTAEAQADLARLAIVRAQREEAAKKREAERLAKEAEAAKRREEMEKAMAQRPAGRGSRSRAKKEREKEKKAAAAAAAAGAGGAGSDEASAS